MTDPAAGSRNTAGSLLRAARERQGLHIAALAAAIKVSPRKLDALEHDRYEELPDATFTRALAQTVCRTLKIDARPVLALLPAADSASLEQVAGSLNTPFRERPGPGDSGLATSAIRPLIWASGVLMVAALVLHFLPERWWQAVTSVTESTPAPTSVTGASTPLPAAAPESVASAAAAAVVDASASAAQGVVGAAAAPVVETVFSAPPPAPGASAPPPSTLLQGWPRRISSRSTCPRPTARSLVPPRNPAIPVPCPWQSFGPVLSMVFVPFPMRPLKSD